MISSTFMATVIEILGVVTVVFGLLLMSPGVGMKTGGRGSWRRKTKKTQKNGNQNGLKVWLAAQRLGCREFGELDSASIILQGSEEALSFQKPELAFNMHANTYAIMGKVEKKPIVEVLTDLISGMNLSGLKDKKEEENNDLGDVPEDVDFSKAEEETKPATE